MKNTEEISPRSALVWFHNNLRVKDNTALAEATQKCDEVLGVYFFDPTSFSSSHLGFPKVGKYRAQFLLESLQGLKNQLSKLQNPLLVFHESPSQKIPQLLQQYSICEVFLQKEWAQEEVQLLQETQKTSPKTVQWNSYFESMLIDHDVHSNYENWMYVTGAGNDPRIGFLM